LDGHGKGVVADVYTAANIAAMKTAGLTMASYRLRTELGVQAWHWNPRGRWSDRVHARGYWTSDDASAVPIMLTHGYRLPRRGTTDENDNAGYSRLDDGDTATFWKSNPYLDHRFTGTTDSLLPQWVIVDLGRPTPVNAIRIHWGAAHAAAFRVQYWFGENVHDVDENPPGRWITFSGGDERRGRGGVDLRRLEDSAVNARFVRLVLTTSAYAAPHPTADSRDSAGYAIRELEIGTMDGTTLHDAMRHGPSSSTQSTTYASSTDPWHSAEDIDVELEQPGFDRVFRSTLTFGRPAMVPVPVLYGTPEDAAAEIRFLRKRGYAIGRIEMGEEPDGQYVTPEDYATLYAQVARAIRADWPGAPLGGPGFQGLESRVMFAWPSDSAGDTWIPRFLAALRARGRPGDFTFFSFEWYPWDDVCEETATQLAAASERLTDRLAGVRRDGIGPDIPLVIAEYGYSAFSGQAEVDLAGALLNADIVGRFLMLGGRAAFLYGWEPTSLDKSPRCDTWGNNMLFLADDQRRIRHRVATYYGTRMLTQEWASPRGGAHAMFAAESDARDAEGNELLSAYVVRRPDGTWATLLVNKDPSRSYRVTLDFAGDRAGRADGRRTVVSYSATEYEWRADGPKGHPLRSEPPRTTTLARGAALVVPAYSMTVVRNR
ncbi:MAG: discoidin domain-containing protein, partial [Gemmatimonadetes bacterium]|nr:discoidin domain-containing protein [Gemmatimonadota bacterium]